MNEKINVAIIGLGFGAEFIPIYKNHPLANMYAICRRNVGALNEIGDAFSIDKRYSDFGELLKDPLIDAVHINSPIPDHAEQSIAALKAGKHVACTVPMATNIESLKAIIKASEESGKKYMMMETVVYSREYLFVKDLYDKGEMGRLQFMRGSHQQEMSGWPGYWEGLPPMHYATHCVSPLLALSGKLAKSVSCHGSGKIDEELVLKYGSPFAIETATIQLQDSDVCAEVTRSLFNTARQYRESFDVYCSNISWEWSLMENEKPVLHYGEEPKLTDVPDFADRLPENIQRFTREGVFDSEENTHLSFTQGSGHGGSHPHLAHEFISAIAEDRDPFPNAIQSANWTAVGLCAHESAMNNGRKMDIPEEFTRDSP